MYTNILIPVDGSNASQQALKYGVSVATNFGATIHALYVLDRKALPVPEERLPSDETITKEIADEVELAFNEAQTLGTDAGLSVQTERREGDPTEEILRYATEQHCDIIVQSPTRESRFAHFLHRSATTQIVQSAPIPVVTIPESDSHYKSKVETILLATDGRSGSDRATKEAIELAAALDAILHIVYIIENRYISSPLLRDVLEREGKHATTAISTQALQSNVKTRTEVIPGNPADELRDYANKSGADLVIMGTYGRRGLDRLVLGSVTRRMIRHAETPIMTVRAKEKRSN
jgi:nucleotide-binding universal stress UspA family protein